MTAIVALMQAPEVQVQLPWVSRDLYNAKCAEALELQSRLRQYLADNDYLRCELDAARADSTHSRSMVADWLAMRQFGKSIFGTAPELPAEPQDADLIASAFAGRSRGRQVVDQKTREFISAVEARQRELRSQEPSE